jgi:hypothetical protein
MRITPENSKINLYQLNELPFLLRKNRMVKIILSANDSMYGDWHHFIKIREQFYKKFGRSMPGVTDIYDGSVRTEFDIKKFFNKSTRKQSSWILQYLPPDFTPPPWLIIPGYQSV